MNSSWPDLVSSKTFCGIVLLVLTLTVIATSVLVPSGSPLFEGDFVPFYAAATLLKNPTTASLLYDIDTLSEVQKQLWPHMEGVYLVGYPPYTIALFIPLTLFAPTVAKALFVLISVVAVIISALLLVRIFAPTRDIKLQTVVILFCFAPLFHSVFGGQNSALSLLLFTITIYLFIKNTRGGDLLAGGTLGLWLFKPHFALVLILGFLAAKRFSILPTLTLMTLSYYGLATYYLGVNWPLLWLEGLKEFVPNDFSNNSHQMMSLLGVAKALILRLQINESISTIFSGLALVGSVSLLVLSLRTMYLAPHKTVIYQAHALALLGNIAILTSPHTLYYDSVLLLPSAFLWIRGVAQHKRPLTIITLLLFSAPLVALKSSLPFSPLIFLSTFLAFTTLKKLSDETEKRDAGASEFQ
ncbi:MAG: glycosyltransferase family 87 protein [Bdellovibrionota bacterium]